MRKVVIIGCFIAGFLLLMIPNVNSINYNQCKECQEQSYNGILKQDITWKPFIKTQPAVDWENMTCDELQRLFWLTFIVEIMTLPIPFKNLTAFISLIGGGIAGAVVVKACFMDCPWAIHIKALLEKLGLDFPDSTEKIGSGGIVK